MCLPRTGHWTVPLRRTLRRVYDPTTRSPVPWLLAGDAALALQGVNVDPCTLEFRAISPPATAYFSSFMRPYELAASMATVVYSRGSNIAPSRYWRSNMHQRVVAWSGGGRAQWLGRWMVDGIPVQVSYVRSIHPDPVCLALQAPARRTHFEGMEVAVVPLEFLLAEATLHNQTPLVHRILHAARLHGYSEEQLRQALQPLSADKASRLLRLIQIGLVAG